MGLGTGLIVSSVTTKYRDLGFLVGFVLQFVMYFSSVVFPLDKLSPGIKFILNFNPMIHLVQLFRAMIIDAPAPSIVWVAYSCAVTLILVLLGVVIFNRVEKTFMDTV
jgi:lipopolysaccharide transport system permease protein